MIKKILLISLIVLIPSVTYGFGFCGTTPSNNTISKKDSKDILNILKNSSSIKIKKNTIETLNNNCMGCHVMISYVKRMNVKQRKEWFGAVETMKKIFKNLKTH